MPSNKVSKQGLAKVKQAIARKGWRVYDDRILRAASRILEPEGNWHLEGPYAYGCSLQTWERFLRRTAIRNHSFAAFCQALGLNPEEISELARPLRLDWGAAPEAPVLYGREQEIDTLADWVLTDSYRLISVTGTAGIGKTRFVRSAVDTIISPVDRQTIKQSKRENFECLIWRQLDEISPRAMLTELLELVSNRQENSPPIAVPETVEGLVAQLMGYLREHQCLLILDNVESILEGGDKAGCYRPGYEGYEKLFRQIGETSHQSCVLIMSREKPRDVEEMEGLLPVRSLSLDGLKPASVQKIFQAIGSAYDQTFSASAQDLQAIAKAYSGNPLFLEIAARHVLRRFDGSLSLFLEQGSTIFGKIRELLTWHFSRLSDTQREILYQLIAPQQSALLASLEKTLDSRRHGHSHSHSHRTPRQKQLPEILDNLERQIPIETKGHRCIVQPLWIKYIEAEYTEVECADISLSQSEKAGKKLPVRRLLSA